MQRGLSHWESGQVSHNVLGKRVEKRVKVEWNYVPPADLILKKASVEKSLREDCGTRDYVFILLRKE